MIKKFKYECDGGAIMLGNETSRVCIPNGYGDGDYQKEDMQYIQATDTYF